MKWDNSLPTSPRNGDGVSFCLNRHYGSSGYSNWKRGATVIQIQEDKLSKNALDTWIRLEDGSTSGQVILNATFGIDQYPEVEQLESFGW
jgi:hypothetical protein